MATKFFFTSVIVLVLMCLFLMRESSDCNPKYGCFGANAAGINNQIQNRKMLFAFKETKTTLKAILQGSSSSMKQNNGEKSMSWELRKVPSGPDPLHHNGGTPKEPETP